MALLIEDKIMVSFILNGKGQKWIKLTKYIKANCTNG
jgi:hypothetical protein